MNQKGFAHVFIIFLVLIGVGVFIVQKKPSLTKQENSTATQSAQIATQSATPSSSATAKPNSSAKASSNSSPKPAATKVPVVRNITLTGFTYEDRNNNGIFDSDDPKLPSMHLEYYDSLYPNIGPYGYWSDLSGNIYLTLDVLGDLVVTPKAGSNFTPKSQKASYNKSTSDIKFGFRSASAPTGNNMGILEGDVYDDRNRNLTRDGGESGVYFYKFYVQDTEGNYYSGQTPDDGGHFKFTNLPLEKTYIIRLSNPTGAFIIDRAETSATLTYTNPQNTNLQIPVYKAQ